MESKVYNFIIDTLTLENWETVERISQLINNALPNIENYPTQYNARELTTIELTKNEVIDIIAVIAHFACNSPNSLNDIKDYKELLKDNNYYDNCKTQAEYLRAIRSNYFRAISHNIIDSVLFDPLKDCGPVRLKHSIIRYGYIHNVLYKKCSQEEQEKLNQNPIYQKYLFYYNQFGSFLRQFLLASNIQYDLFIQTNFNLTKNKKNLSDIHGFTTFLSQIIVNTDKYFTGKEYRKYRKELNLISRINKNEIKRLDIVHLFIQELRNAMDNSDTIAVTDHKQTYLNTFAYTIEPFIPSNNDMKVLYYELLLVEINRSSKLLCMNHLKVEEEFKKMDIPSDNFS